MSEERTENNIRHQTDNKQLRNKAQNMIQEANRQDAMKPAALRVTWRQKETKSPLNKNIERNELGSMQSEENEKN